MYRLIYKSKSSSEIVHGTLKSILKSSYVVNSENDVTGALLATKTHFLQVLEGEYKAVNETFHKIGWDPRHEKVELIHFGPAATRAFEGWSMRGFALFDMDPDLTRRLKLKYGDDEGEVKFPTEEWAVLSLMYDIRVIDGK